MNLSNLVMPNEIDSEERDAFKNALFNRVETTTKNSEQVLEEEFEIGKPGLNSLLQTIEKEERKSPAAVQDASNRDLDPEEIKEAAAHVLHVFHGRKASEAMRDNKELTKEDWRNIAKVMIDLPSKIKKWKEPKLLDLESFIKKVED